MRAPRRLRTYPRPRALPTPIAPSAVSAARRVNLASAAASETHSQQQGTGTVISPQPLASLSTRKSAVDVWCLKMCRQFSFEVGDLAVQFGDDADCGAGGGRECGGDGGGSGELFGAQGVLNDLGAVSILRCAQRL